MFWKYKVFPGTSPHCTLGRAEGFRLPLGIEIVPRPADKMLGIRDAARTLPRRSLSAGAPQQMEIG